MSIRNLGNKQPKIHNSAYVDSQACVIGEVEIGENSSIWPMTVVRGDVNSIKIGNQTNIQDGSILHVTHKREQHPEGSALIIGNGVTVGHGAILHACQIDDYCLVGMGATIMDDCIIEHHSMIAAGSLLPPGKHVKSGELWLGNPAKKVKNLNEKQMKELEYSASHYVKLIKLYLTEK